MVSQRCGNACRWAVTLPATPPLSPPPGVCGVKGEGVVLEEAPETGVLQIDLGITVGIEIGIRNWMRIRVRIRIGTTC
jgi:hypothetical protein